ncbi:MAG: hypothetical protein R6U42_03815 [Halomonas sp.]
MPASNPTSSNFAFLSEHDTFVAIVKGAELSLPPVNPARLRRVGGLLREAALWDAGFLLESSWVLRVARAAKSFISRARDILGGHAEH